MLEKCYYKRPRAVFGYNNFLLSSINGLPRQGTKKVKTMLDIMDGFVINPSHKSKVIGKE